VCWFLYFRIILYGWCTARWHYLMECCWIIYKWRSWVDHIVLHTRSIISNWPFDNPCVGIDLADPMPLNMASHWTLRVYIFGIFGDTRSYIKCFKRLKNVILCLNGNSKNHWDLALRHIMKISCRGIWHDTHRDTVKWKRYVTVHRDGISAAKSCTEMFHNNWLPETMYSSTNPCNGSIGKNSMVHTIFEDIMWHKA
jgi:hypothetical protein